MRKRFRVLIYSFLFIGIILTLHNGCKKDATNIAPIASFSVTPINGTIFTTFVFDASSSTDHEDTPSVLKVRWDFDGDGSWDSDWAAAKSQSHKYSIPNTYSAKLEVKDTKGLSNLSIHKIIVSDANGQRGTFTDPRDNKTYKTIVIGNQIWFAENLNYKTEWSVWYNLSSANGNIYGSLYALYEALEACPYGWHLSSDSEWNQLIDFLGGQEEAVFKLKSTSGWIENSNGSNSSGFTALPGGFAEWNKGIELGETGVWWSPAGNGAVQRVLRFENNKIYRHVFNSPYKFSVRCIKN